MGKKILLADDSITIQKVIELTFSDEDFEVVTVGNGRLAIERLPETRPDLVLCDIIMPEKDGYEVCDFIKKTPSLSHIPVLLLTGAFEPFDQEKAARVGCDGFLAKPFEPQTLIAKVKELLARAASKPAAAPMAAPAPPPSQPAAPAPAAFAAPAAVSTPAWSTAMPSPPPAPAPVPAPAPFAAPYIAPVAATPSRVEPEPEPESEPEVEPDDFAPGAIFGKPIDISTYEADDDVPTTQVPAYRGPSEPKSATPASLEELYDNDSYGATDELMPLSADEADSVSSVTAEPEEDEPAPWAQPTVEVPLEMRAQAGVESAQRTASDGFEEVFDDEASASAARETVSAPASAPPTVERGFGFVRQEDVSASPSSPSAPSPAAPPTVQEGFGWVREADVPAASPTPTPAPPAPAPAAATPSFASATPAPAAVTPVDSSFRDVAPSEQEAKTSITRSVAGEVQVPVDMVEKIAQRVVAQISEKVIREIAWEVIPDLAEALIKREIDRLKAELQQT